MLRIHKPNRKLLIISITSILSIGVLLGLCGLVYTPELSHAEMVEYPVITHPNLQDITYMQEMTKQICINSRENDTKQLVDSRDDKRYWVTKLKDGNCWMTQNLDLDIPAEGLSSSDTDVVEDWDSSSTYKPVATQKTASPSGFNPSYNYVIASWDPAQGGQNIYCPDGLCGSNDSSIISSNGNHDDRGNYYSWWAATAGSSLSFSSSSSTDDRNATNSICPKGWRLPIDSQFEVLMEGMTSYNQTRVSPYYFVVGGYVDGGRVIGYDNRSFYWSSTLGRHLGAMSEGVWPSSAASAAFGMFVRCMSAGEENGSRSNNVEITINPTISLDVADVVEIGKIENNPSTVNLDVKVVSNQGYTVQINTKNHPELTSSTTEMKIPSMGGVLNGNSNGWGIKKPEEETYTEVTNTAQTFYQSTVAEIKTIPFIVGVSTAPDLPNGEYSTEITVTAAQN